MPLASRTLAFKIVFPKSHVSKYHKSADCEYYKYQNYSRNYLTSDPNYTLCSYSFQNVMSILMESVKKLIRKVKKELLERYIQFFFSETAL